MRETARSAHVWDKGWETALAALQEGLGKMAEKQNGTGYAARSLSARTLAAILSWGKGVRDLLSGDRAEFGFPLAPAGSCAVFFQ